ncbi:MAG: InlB B-repeat-containing protein, partial [Clostridia bacterium]|nr:InlB B-repeat-containing protein [Clostridia bacterium]
MNKRRFFAILMSLIMMCYAMPLGTLAEEMVTMPSVTSNVVNGGDYGEVSFTYVDETGATVPLDGVTVAVGEPVGDLPEPPTMPEGFLFEGWVDQNGDPVTAETVVSGDMTIHAVFHDTMPAQRFTGSANGLSVLVVAPRGAFPENTTMKVVTVKAEEVQDIVAEAIEGEINSLKAVDITFYNEAEEEIEPAEGSQVNVTMRAYGMDTESNLQVVHIDAEQNPEIVADMEGNRAQFDTKSFSIYIVVETGDDARLQVEFIGADGETVMSTQVINKRQLDKVELYIVDPGAGTLPAGTMFDGWTTVKNYTADTESKTIADIRVDIAAELNKDGGIHDLDKLTYYAMVFKSYTVNYIDEKGIVVKTDVILVRADDTTVPTYTVSESYVPYPTDEEGVVAEFMGWQQLVPEVTGEMVLYKVGDTIDLEDVTTYLLKAYTQRGHWLSFDENLSNASYTEPQFVAIGDKPTKPADPTRVGYRFDGWYTKDASAARDGKVDEENGSQFNFNQELTANTTVYGKWTVDTRAKYSIIVWKQRATEDEYDFAESFELEGTVGATINTVDQNGSNVNTGTTPAQARNARYNDGTWKEIAYTGFHCAEIDQNVKIAPEGTTVLNVYYDRNIITVNFDAGNNRYMLDEGDGNYKRRVTYTGRFEAPLTFTWPTTTYSNNSGTSGARSVLWQYGTTTLSFIGTFKLPTPTNVSISLTTDNGGDYPIRFIQMDVNGDYPENSPHEEIMMSGGNFSITDKYAGFRAAQYRTYTSTWGGGGSWSNWTNLPATPPSGGTYARVDSGYAILEIRYQRLQEHITYLDGIYVDGTGALTEQTSRGQLDQTDLIYYDADVSSYGKGKSDYYKPEFNGYVFLGWFADDRCTKEYTFTKMPADGITVYAKWGVAEYQVTLHPNDTTSDPIQYTSTSQSEEFWVEDGEKIGNVGGERIYFDLVGWYTDEALQHAYDFDAFRINKTTVGKYGKLYKESEIDPRWPTTIGEIDLYAKWRSKLVGAEGINLDYIPGEGTLPGEPGEQGDKKLYVDTAEAIAIEAATPNDEESYVFSHWEVQKWNGSEFVKDTDVFPGDPFTVHVENAKITEKGTQTVVSPDVLDKNKEYTYTIQVKAVYVEKEKGIDTFINWYDNYTGGKVATSTGIKINEPVPVPDAPTRAGYKFLGWIKGIEEDGTTTTLTDLYITYDETNGYSTDVAHALIPIEVAADEHLVGDGTKHNAMYAKWEAVDVDYKVEFYYEDVNGEYVKDGTMTVTRQQKTDTEAEVTNDDKGQTKDGQYELNTTKNELWKANVNGDGSTVLKLYFDIALATLTVSKTVEVPEGFEIDTDKEFNFKVTLDKAVPSTFSVEGVTVSSDGKELTFKLKHEGSIELTNLPVGAAYTVTETEVPDGYTPDPTEVTGTVAKEGNTAAITNNYEAKEIIVIPTDATTTFGNKKVTAAAEDEKTKTFAFTLAAVTAGAPMPASNRATVDFDSGETTEKPIPFGEIKYEKPGEYKYTITEEAAGDGWTTTGSPATVTVTITDNGDGTLSAKVEETPTIENKYSVNEITVDPTDAETTFGKKDLTATTEDGEGHEFTFTLTAVSGKAADGETDIDVP